MKNVSRAVAAMVVVASAGLLAAGPVTPKTPWGDPDLQGVWTSDAENGVPFERPAAFGTKAVLEGDELEQVLDQRAEQRSAGAPVVGGETGAGPTHWYEHWTSKSNRTSMIVDPPDGRVPPLTAEAEQRAAARAALRAGRGPSDSWEDRSLWDQCITRGVPNVMYPTIYNNNTRIVQAPGYVAITYEMIHETRIVPLDGRPHVGDKVRGYLGDARGHWDGSTLVVDTTNFSSKTNYRGSSETLHLIERFTRVGGAVRYEMTIDDPHTFTRPWTAMLNLEAQKADMFEYGCHEGNYAMPHILSGARADEAAAKVEGRAPRTDGVGEER